MAASKEERKASSFRGYDIERVGDRFKFKDTDEWVDETWKQRPCGFCGLKNTKEGHDGCLGTIPDALNACCGHGEKELAYIQFPDRDVRGEAVFQYLESLK
ncbi:MAG: hypothetical protein CL489_10315 [Acidobacteria bacterium]|nr:hypothetical protein [Acidobacteriota bacterium]|tara:strand:+ start:11324 stop:11626 length:303 start_codon:yes stop_codon:yes gene_type:complete